jgi:hypothetical protein
MRAGPREQLIFGVALELGGNARQERDLHKIHKVEITNQPQADEPRRTRVKRQATLHAVALQERFAARYFLKNFPGKVFPLKQQTKLCFLQRRIIQKREQHIRRRMMQERGKFFAGGDERPFAICCFSGHFSIWRRAPRPPQESFVNFRFERAVRLASARRQLPHQKMPNDPRLHRSSPRAGHYRGCPRD